MSQHEPTALETTISGIVSRIDAKNAAREQARRYAQGRCHDEAPAGGRGSKGGRAGTRPSFEAGQGQAWMICAPDMVGQFSV